MFILPLQAIGEWMRETLLLDVPRRQLFSPFPIGEVCRISDPFRLFCVFRAALPLFLAQLDIRSRCDLSSLTMGGGKIGARTLTQPPQQKRSFLSLKENEMMERGCGFNG